MLYSHHAATPAPLPHRIRFPDGSTRTDASTFTPEELELAPAWRHRLRGSHI